MKTVNANNAILAITSGEPAGIGPDICLDLVNHQLPCRVVVLGDKQLLQERAKLLGKTIEFQSFDLHRAAPQGVLEVWHIPLTQPCRAGELNTANANYVLQLLDTAYQGIADGIFSGMVTAPLHKGIINEAGGVFFSGHTEYLAEKSQTKQVVMMLAGGGLRVALLTTHLPLKDVANSVSTELVEQVVRIIHHDLQRKFGIKQPRILVAGLNPHAGENGHLGWEEVHIINPTLAHLRADGIDVQGCFPADTIFQPFMLKNADVVLAMYHDQGLPVLKYASFGQGVNITLGLPFVRTSVDHGTALDLAGTGQAHSGSLLAAIEVATEMLHDSNKA